MSKEHFKSYVVQQHPGGGNIRVVGSTFAPGYSWGHKASFDEAIDHAILRKKNRISIEQSDILELEALKEQGETT